MGCVKLPMFEWKLTEKLNGDKVQKSISEVLTRLIERGNFGPGRNARTTRVLCDMFKNSVLRSAGLRLQQLPVLSTHVITAARVKSNHGYIHYRLRGPPLLHYAVHRYYGHRWRHDINYCDKSLLVRTSRLGVN